MTPLPPPAVAAVVLGAAYLIGAVPFGYLVGRLRGVDQFGHGSRNIGATNAVRVLGRGYGVLVFALDFAKGSVPVALAVPAAAALGGTDWPNDWLRTGAAALAFLGHLYPVALGFRGGKGVATGAGVVAVLVPGPFAVALLTWVLVALVTRMVSVASVATAVALVLARIALTTDPFGTGAVVTGFIVAGAALVVVRHRANLARVRAGTESRIADGPARQTLLAMLHVVAVGVWAGATGFFGFAVAPALFASFRQVVDESPSDRTAFVGIVPASTSPEDRAALASALAGAAVGPVFPRLFALQAVCGAVGLCTALAWRDAVPRGLHRGRVAVLAAAVALVAVGWPLSEYVSELRTRRFDPDPAAAAAAKAAFGPWHVASLASSAAATLLAGVALAMAARLPSVGGIATPDG